MSIIRNWMGFCQLKGIVHFEIKIWYPSAYPKGIQDVGVFFSSVDPILAFYLPLYDWQTRTVWPKNIKIGSTEEKRHLHLGCPWGKLIDTKF